jgi:hypothetical protein
MEHYKVISLVDITCSGASRYDTDKIKIGQQSNFNSLVQAIGIRANVEWNQIPKKQDGRFPDPIEGAGTYWTWEFITERNQIFFKGNDPVGLLLDDLHNVPIINGLNNTVDINPSVFQTSGDKQNIWISKIN